MLSCMLAAAAAAVLFLGGGAGLGASAVAPLGSEERGSATPWLVAVSACALLAASVRKTSPVQMYTRGRKCVRQWEPERILPSEVRAIEDRIRIKMRSAFPHQLEEAVEVLEDFAKETGGDIEGPLVLRQTRIHKWLNKSPNGHKKSKYHLDSTEHFWYMDYYPPAEGGLDSIMKIRLPHKVYIKIE